MRRIGVALAVWIVAVLLLWLGGGLGLRGSAVLSLIIAIIFDQVIEIQRYLSEPKRGVFHLHFNADLERILLDLGIIDLSTDWKEFVALQKAPDVAFPIFRTSCVLIPEANLLVWPSIQKYQSKLELNVPIRLPIGCPLAESVHRDLLSRYGQHFDVVADHEDGMREVQFFIEDAYSDFEFGLYVPTAFAEERITTGGFGSACVEYSKKGGDFFGKFRLVVGRSPATLFGPRFPEHESFRQYVRHRRAKREFSKILKDRFESRGWVLEDHEKNEYLPGDLEIAKHKYMEIEIFDREC